MVGKLITILSRPDELLAMLQRISAILRLWFEAQFLCIYREIVDPIGLKFGDQNQCVIEQDWLTFRTD